MQYVYIIDAMSGETYHIDNNTQYIQHAFNKNTKKYNK